MGSNEENNPGSTPPEASTSTPPTVDPEIKAHDLVSSPSIQAQDPEPALAPSPTANTEDTESPLPLFPSRQAADSDSTLALSPKPLNSNSSRNPPLPSDISVKDWAPMPPTPEPTVPEKPGFTPPTTSGLGTPRLIPRSASFSDAHQPSILRRLSTRVKRFVSQRKSKHKTGKDDDAASQGKEKEKEKAPVVDKSGGRPLGKGRIQFPDPAVDKVKVQVPAKAKVRDEVSVSGSGSESSRRVSTGGLFCSPSNYYEGMVQAWGHSDGVGHCDTGGFGGRQHCGTGGGESSGGGVLEE